MRKTVLFLSIVLSIICTHPGLAQQKVKIELSTVKERGKNVDFTVVSSRPFIFGGNRYVFHVGERLFFLHKQMKDNGKGIITFFVPTEDFESLPDGAGMYLTYGDGPANEADLEAKSKINPMRCASLGKFSRQLLK